MGSTRFPGKPLAPLLGLPMVEHVRCRVALSDAVDDVLVATCDGDILDVVEKAGGVAVMTSDAHERCTDRVAEAMEGFAGDVVINIQGDEPLVRPEMLNSVIQVLASDPDLQCANLVSKIRSDDEFEDPNTVKVVQDPSGNILYMSREPIPSRHKAGSLDFPRIRQTGIIAFRSSFLKVFQELAQTPLECIESVDMMRAIEHGYQVRGVLTDHRLLGVDLPGDVPRVEALLADDDITGTYLNCAS